MPCHTYIHTYKHFNIHNGLQQGPESEELAASRCQNDSTQYPVRRRVFSCDLRGPNYGDNGSIIAMYSILKVLAEGTFTTQIMLKVKPTNYGHLHEKTALVSTDKVTDTGIILSSLLLLYSF